MTTVYLDNCCFNRPFDNQLHPVVQLETQAKLLIQSEAIQGKVNLVWSFMLTHENSDNPYDDRREQIALWKNVAKTIGCTNFADFSENKRYRKIRNQDKRCYAYCVCD